MPAALRERDFALLWGGTSVSLLGDGIYLVAIAFQVYAISNVPTALSIVGLSWSLGLVAFLVTGGVASDRFDRRRVMIAADAARLVLLAAMSVLCLTGAVELWHLAALAFLYGAGEAFFGPAFGAFVPDVVPPPLLVQANAVETLVRPLTLRFAGPALGGVLVSAASPGVAFAVDAATFGISMVFLALIRTTPPRAPARPVGADVREGIRFVREHAWLWATLVAASVVMLVLYGPLEVLVPYLIKNDLGGGAHDFGVFLAAQGAGAIAASLWMARAGRPRRPVTFVYLAWGGAAALVPGCSVATATWQLAVIGGLFAACTTLGMVVWLALIQTRVPARLRGRVTSLDWLVSLGLTPLSFALAGPVAAGIGVDATLAGAGAIGALSTFALLLLVPGLSDAPGSAARGSARPAPSGPREEPAG